ncbi:hypothetical protein TWF106_006460 [Orbilia oligospora]|uniref:Uncharacterized protein n=1 Tax=Orbilia oligospora TaxID=2813651 RepID=A0A7C8QSN3_ORBOL|nr:hypothetical protein TWF106_006460 [Orbilia oligospora]
MKCKAPGSQRRHRFPYRAKPSITPTPVDTDSFSEKDYVGVAVFRWYTSSIYGARRQILTLQHKMKDMGIGFRVESLLWYGILITVEGLESGDPRKDAAERLLHPYLKDNRILWFQDEEELGPDLLREYWNIYLEEGVPAGAFSFS